MIALPVANDQKEGAMLVGLYGNADYFAFYNETDGSFEIVKNGAAGNGIKTARFLIEKGATKTAYIHLGSGPFGELEKAGVAVFYAGKAAMGVAEAVQKIESGSFPEVTAANAQALLDPGTDSGDCSCGCKG
jgi:predicted Fe-Mo cluster-binding NifX family protein